MVDILAAASVVKAAYESAKKLNELAVTLKHVELRTELANLMNSLADANIKLAELKSDLLELQQENEKLKARDATPTPTLKWGCYKFEGIEGLYCPACYDSKKGRYLTTRLAGGNRMCTVCRVELGAG